MSYELYKTRCPSCAKLGRDKPGDNLSVYSDGHEFCFSCKYLYNPISNRIQSIRNQSDILDNNGVSSCFKTSSQQQNNPIKLPSDISIDYPQKVIDWIVSYQLTIEDLHNNNFLWSEYFQRLVYPVWKNEQVIFWTGRYFGNDPTKSKWINRGQAKDLIHCINGNSNVIVIVEDIISGIKITKAFPNIGVLILFNSHNPINKLKQLSYHSNPKKFILWLDNDKSKESIFFVREAGRSMLDIKTVFSRKDPKDETIDSIKEILTTWN